MSSATPASGLQRVFERDGQTHNRRMRHDSKRCGLLTSLARWCGVLLAAALVAGCAGPRIDAHTYRSNSHDSRAQFLILHYTAVDLATSIRILTQLENKYADFDGLNLTWETLEGVAKHNGPLIKRTPVSILGKLIGKGPESQLPRAIADCKALAVSESP